MNVFSAEMGGLARNAHVQVNVTVQGVIKTEDVPNVRLVYTMKSVIKNVPKTVQMFLVVGKLDSVQNVSQAGLDQCAIALVIVVMTLATLKKSVQLAKTDGMEEIAGLLAQKIVIPQDVRGTRAFV